MDVPILSPIFGYVIKFLHGFCNNYLLTLFIFAVLVKLLLLPLGIKQQKNTVKQARMRPKEMAIRRKYAGRDDQKTKQKMSEEIMQLYQEENINPMGGCLPLLIQMPVIFALYGVIVKPLTYISFLGKEGVKFLTEAFANAGVKLTGAYNEISMIQYIANNDDKTAKIVDEFTKLAKGSELAGENIVEGISDLSKSFTIFGLDLTVIPQVKLNAYILIPILTFVFAFLSTKIIRKFTYQPAMQDEAQAKSMGMMDWMMPLLSVWISFSVSSAVAVYWIYQNVLSAVQQITLYKLYPVPPVTEEQIREAEMQLKGKNSKKKEAVKADYEIDDYDKTTETDKSGNNKKQAEKNFTGRKAGISPKIKKIVAQKGKAPKARRKI